MSELQQIEIHERVARLEEKQLSTFDMIKDLTAIVERQGRMITKSIIVFTSLFFAGIISNGGTDAVINLLKNMSSFLI